MQFIFVKQNEWLQIKPQPLATELITVDKYKFSPLFIKQYNHLLQKCSTVEGQGFFGNQKTSQEVLRLCIKVIYQLEISIKEKFDIRIFIAKDLIDKFYFDLLEVKHSTYSKYYSYYSIIISCLKLWGVESGYENLSFGITREHLINIETRIKFTKRHSKKLVAADLRECTLKKRENMLHQEIRDDWFNHFKRSKVISALCQNLSEALPMKKYLSYQRILITDCIMCSGCRPLHLMCMKKTYLTDALKTYRKSDSKHTNSDCLLAVHVFGMHKTSDKYDIIMLRVDTISALINLFDRSPIKVNFFVNAENSAMKANQASRIVTDTTSKLLNIKAGSQKLRILIESMANDMLKSEAEKEIFSTNLQHSRYIAKKSYVQNTIPDKIRSKIANKVLRTSTNPSTSKNTYFNYSSDSSITPSKKSKSYILKRKKRLKG